jgi:hypothetical protein
MADHPSTIYLQQTKRRPKNKLENVAHFLALENSPPKHHIHHTSHHDFTTQEPRSSTHFFQNTPQNPRKSTKLLPVTTPKKSRQKISS